MPQQLKEHVRQRIVAAAVQVFAARGHAAATMAEIAAAAGISTGNIYRYYESKSALFHDVIDDAFVRRFTTLLRRRVESLEGVDDVGTLETSHLYHLASEDLLRFCIDNRLRVVILLGRSAGSRHAGFGERTVGDLIALAIAHFRALDPALEVTRALRFTLEQIYRSLLRTMVTVLGEFEDEAAIRASVAGYSRYHLAGLKNLFEGAPETGLRAPRRSRAARRPKRKR
jgi:AcrR family transcriptional regulator